MSNSTRELLPSVLIAAIAGVLAVAVNAVVALMGVLVVGLAVVAVVALRRERGAERLHSSFAAGLVGLGILFTAWIGVRGPAQVPISDLPFLMAIPLVTIAALTRRDVLPVPAWLLYAGGALIISALLPIMFVVDPPPLVLAEQSAVTLGTTSSRASELALLARMEYSMIIIPVLIGAVAASLPRARAFSDLWLASATVCALVGCLDRLAGTGIGPSLVGNLEGLQLGTRATGLTAHPNYLGLFAAMALPVGITRAFQTSGLSRLASVTSIAILLLGVQLSGSRLGLVTALLGVLLMFVLVARFRMVIALGFAAMALAAVISLVVLPSAESALERLGGSPSTEGATNERIRVIEDALENGLSHPLTGIGFDRIFDSHSIPVQFLQAGGIIALAAFMLWWFGMGRLGWMLSRDRRQPPAATELSAALFAALMAWLITGVINPQVSERFMYVPAGLLLGLGLMAARDRGASEALPDEVGAGRGQDAQAPAPRSAQRAPVGAALANAGRLGADRG